MNSRTLIRAFFVTVLVAAFTMVSLADTIRLKDGSIIKGKITAFGRGSFTVVIGEGSRRRELVFLASDIESIEFDSADSAVRSTVRQVPVSDPVSEKKPPQVIVSDNMPASTANQPQAKPSPSATTEPEKRTNPGDWNRLPNGSAKTTGSSTASQKPTSSNTATTKPTARSTSSASAKTQPIEVSVHVLGDNSNNGWTNSGWVVKKGQKIRITGAGEVDLGGGKVSPPEGLYDLEDGSKLLKAVPTGALIAVIGDDNNDFIYVGKTREFVATRDGALFLGVNEGNLNDNKGAFDVKVEIAPDSE